jgi:hypothetical protein
MAGPAQKGEVMDLMRTATAEEVQAQRQQEQEERDVHHERVMQMQDWCCTAYYTWGWSGLGLVAALSAEFDTLETIDPYREK